jgi:hypothetical protein
VTAVLEEEEELVRKLEGAREGFLRHDEVDEEFLGGPEILIALPGGVEVLARAPDQRVGARAAGRRRDPPP